MKKRASIIVALFLLLLPLAVAQDQQPKDDSWIYHSSYLILDTRMRAGMDLQAIADNSYVESVSATLDFYPRETTEQQILKKDFRPEPRETDDGLAFEWNKPPIGSDLALIMDSRVKVTNDPPRITGKVPFPLANLPSNIRPFTQATKIIDINDDISSLASSLAEGEDDLVVVVDKIAAWVTQNIQYNLTTVTIEASQKASWVLRNKEGVCDELTSLFISMLRSLGIPARFVAGISYTNSPQFDQKWGPHGWAEVYFPGRGWVPYDVTYGEYGYVDPTHIVAKYSADAGKISTKFVWRARNTDVDVLPFQTDVRVQEYGDELIPRVDIDVELLKDNVGFGSSNLVEATVQNLAGYYQSIDVTLAKTTRLTVLDGNRQHLLLRPNEARKLFWIVKVDDNLQDGYQYTFPIIAYTLGNVSDTKQFRATRDGVVVSSEKARDELRARQTESPKTIARGLDIQCVTDKENYYPGEKAQITCEFINTGNTLFHDIRLCVDGVCETEDIGIAQRKRLDIERPIRTAAIDDIIVTAHDQDIDERRIVSLQVDDIPQLEIADLSYPANVSFDDQFHVRFTLRKLSRSSPKDVRTTLELGAGEAEFSLDSLDGVQPYDVSAAGDDLVGLENNFVVHTTWQDDRGKKYETAKLFTIALNRPDSQQQMKLWFATTRNWLAGLFG